MKQIERNYLGRITLSSGSVAQNSFNFPLGEVYRKLWLNFSITYTVSGTPSGNTAFDNPVLELLKNIQFEVDRDGITHNLAGKMLYYMALLKFGTAPNIDNGSFDPNTAGTYNMSVSIPLCFIDRMMLRPEDTGLDSRRYSQMFLRITLGDATDVLETEGTFSGSIDSAYCDVELEKFAGEARASILPLLLPKYEMETTPQTTSQSQFDLIRAKTRALKRLYIFASNGGSVSKPFSGNGDDGIIEKIDLETESRVIEKTRYREGLKNIAKLEYGIESLPTGLYILDFVRDYSNFSALPTGDFAKLQLQCSYESSLPSGTNIIALASESLNALKE